MPFRRELSAVQVEYDELSSALARRDPAGVRIAGCRLVAAWLGVEVALLELVERGEPGRRGLGPQVRDAERVWKAASFMVRELFRRALGEIATWPGDLRGLRVTLGWLSDHLAASDAVGYPPMYFAARHAPGRVRRNPRSA